MASQDKMFGSTASISEAKDRIIIVGNLPQDAKRDLLQCLFPEAVKIIMNMDEHRNRKRGSSLVMFPTAKSALFYTDKNHSIKLDSRLLSIHYLGPQRSRGGGSGGGSGNSAYGGSKSGTAPSSSQSKSKPRNEPQPKSESQSMVNSQSKTVPHPKAESQSKANPQPKADSQSDQKTEDDKMVVIQNLPKGIGKIGVLQIIPTVKKVTFKGPPQKSKFESALLEFNTVAQANAVIKKNGQLKVGDHMLHIESLVTNKKRAKNQNEGEYRGRSPPKSSNQPKDRSGGGGSNSGDKSNQQKMAAKGSDSEDKRFVYMSKRNDQQQQLPFGTEMGQYEKDLANLFNFPKAGTNPAALQYGLAALENLLSQAAKMGMNELKSLLTANPRLHQLFAENQDFQPRLQKLFAHNQDFQPQLKRLFAANQVFLPKLQMLITAANQQKLQNQQQCSENINFPMGPLGQFGPQGPIRPHGHSMGPPPPPPQGSMRPPSGPIRASSQPSGRPSQGPGGMSSMQEQQAFKKQMMMRQQRQMYKAGGPGRGGGDEEEEEDYSEEQGFGDARDFQANKRMMFGRDDGSSGSWSKPDESRSHPPGRMFDEEQNFPFRRRARYDEDDERRLPSRQQQQKQQRTMFTEEMEAFAEKQKLLLREEEESNIASASKRHPMYGASQESMYNEMEDLPQGKRRHGFFDKGSAGGGGGDNEDFPPPHKRRPMYVDEPERGPNRHQVPYGGRGGGGDNQQDFNEGPKMYGGYGGSGGRDDFGGGGGGRDDFGGGSGGVRDDFGGGGVNLGEREVGSGYGGPRDREYPGARPSDEFRQHGGSGVGGEDDRMGLGGNGRKQREMFDESMDFQNRNPKMFGKSEHFHNRGGAGGGDNFSGRMMPPQQSALDASGVGHGGGGIGGVGSKPNYVTFDYNHQPSNVPLSDMEPFQNSPGNFPGGGGCPSSSMMGQDTGSADRHGPSMSRNTGGDDGNQFGQRGMEPSGGSMFDSETDQSYSREDQFGQRPSQFDTGMRNPRSAMRNNSSAYRFEDGSMSAGNQEPSREVPSGDLGGSNTRMSMDNSEPGRGFRDRDREGRDTVMGTWRSPLGMGNYQQERDADLAGPGTAFGDDMGSSRQMDDTTEMEQQQQADSGNFRGNVDRSGFQYGENARGQSEGDDFSDWNRRRDAAQEGDSGRRMQMSESHDYGHKSSESYNRYFSGGGEGDVDDGSSYPIHSSSKNDDVEDPVYKWGQGIGGMERGSSRERNWMSRGESADYRRVEDDNNDSNKGSTFGFRSDDDNNNRGAQLYEDNWQSRDYRRHDDESDYPGGNSASSHRGESSYRHGASYGRDDNMQESSRGDDEAPYLRSGRSVAFERDSYNYNQDFNDSANDDNANVDEGGAGMDPNLSDDRKNNRRQRRYSEQKLGDDLKQSGSGPPLGWRNHTYFSSSPSASGPSSSPSRRAGGSRQRNQRGSGQYSGRPYSGGVGGYDDDDDDDGRDNRDGGDQAYRRGYSSGRSWSRYGNRASYGDMGEGSGNAADQYDDKEERYGQESMRKVVLSREWKDDAAGGLSRRHKQSRWN